jgi:uncharacterized protein YegL
MLYAWKLFSTFVVLALLFLLAPAAVLLGPLEDVALPGGSAAVLAGEGDLDYIVISPDSAFIDGGGEGTQAYIAEAFDAQGNSLGDVTQDTNFTIEPEAGGTWEGCLYTSEHVGDWVVTGTHITDKTDTAGLHILETPTYPGGSPAPPEGGPVSAGAPGTNTETERPAKSTPVTAGAPPHLEVAKSVSPETICIDDQATVTLNVTGAGSPAEEHFPLDVMLIIDRSDSMEGTKLTAAKAAAKTFVGLLNSTSDRSGLVSFSYWKWIFLLLGDWEAELDQKLTFNQSATNRSITSLTAYGNTAMGEGIYKANEELIDNGRLQPPTVYAEVLLSDGIWNTGRNPISAAQEAANNNITIYTIGLGAEADNATMQNIANITGGKYYYAPNSSSLEDIYGEIAGELSDMAGTDVVVTEVLPGYVNYVAGSAVPTPNSTSGQNLTWKLGSISIGDTRTMTFNVTFDNPGYQLVDVYPDTRVNYTNYQGNPAGEAFPEAYITVTAAINRYSLTISSTSGGNVTTPGEGTYTYNARQVVDLVATADANYHFVNWTGDTSAIANKDLATTSITMNGNYSIVANFAINRYNLSTSSTSGGNVTTPGEGTYTYNASQVVNLAATADANYHFVNWTGNVGTIGNVTSATTNITMNGNYSIVANFAINRCNLSTSSTSGGNVTTPGEGVFTYNASQVVDLIATPDSGYHFVNWTGDTSAIANKNLATTSITMNGNYSIVANFKVIPVVTYNLSISSTSGGNVTTPGEGTYTYNASQVVDLVATPDSGYHFVNWTGDTSTIANKSLATTSITMNGNYSIVANFEEHLPKICVSPSSLPLTVAPNTTVTATYTITNCGGGTLNWNSSNVTYDPSGNMTWLTQNITSGTLTANASDTVLVTVNTTGLTKGNYTATITITGSTFILPVIVVIKPTTDIDVMRNLPGTALMPNETYPGDTFDVYVNFTAVMNDFNAIGLTDLAPGGWTVQVDKNWTYPTAYSVEARGNKVEILWSGPFSSDTNFSVLYKVTVPETAKPGINLFPNCDISKAWVGYYIAELGPYTSCVWGDYQMMITVPGDVIGETRDVNANLLSDVNVTLLKEGEGAVISDASTPNYSNAAYRTGMYWEVSTKALYYDINMTNMTMLPDYYINLTTPELLAPGYVFDFEGNYGLVPRACNMSYALKSVNLWLSPPENHPEWGIDEWKAMDSIHSWQYPS